MILCTLIEEEHFAVHFYWKRISPVKLIWSNGALNMRAVIIGSIVTFPCSCCKLWKCQTSRLSVAILACVINWTSHCTHTIEVYPSAPRSARKVGLSINALALRQSDNKSVFIFTMRFYIWTWTSLYFSSAKNISGMCSQSMYFFVMSTFFFYSFFTWSK